MYKPPYWFYKNIKFPEKEIDQVIDGVIKKNEELIRRDEPLLSSYFFKFHERPDKIWRDKYHTIMEGITKEMGMFSTTKYVFEYWSQLYYKNVGHPSHHHVDPERSSLGEISWVHFHRTPKEKCFMFVDHNGQVFTPEEQNDGDIICFPNYLWHQVFPNKNDSQRFVCAGNLLFIHIDSNENQRLADFTR